MSEKREKFLKTRNRRVKETANALRKLGKLANKDNYDYEPEDVQYIYDTLNEVITDVNEKFKDPDEEIEKRVKEV